MYAYGYASADWLLADHGQHVIAGDDFAVLVRDFRVPCNFAVALLGTQRLGLTGEPHFDAVARLDRLDEAQVIEPKVREHRTVRRIDEQTGCGRDQEVAVRHTAAEQ